VVNCGRVQQHIMIMNITGKQAFIEFLNDHPEKGVAYPDIVYNTVYDISINAFIKLPYLKISFEEYEQFLLVMHPDTNELFLGDMNDGGHATRCRIIKIHRDDLFTKQAGLKKWHDNRAWEMWKY
jgi:hypothetical protein